MDEIKGLRLKNEFLPGGTYWKSFDKGLKNRKFQYKLGINVLNEDINMDYKSPCGFPGLYFSTYDVCMKNAIAFNHTLIAQVYIPYDADVCEPINESNDNKKARTNKLEILKVYDIRTGKNVTYRYRKQK